MLWQVEWHVNTVFHFTVDSLGKQDFIQQKKYPNWTHVTTVREDAETPLFKQNFTNWIGKDEVTKLPTARTSTAAKGIAFSIVKVSCTIVM